MCASVSDFNVTIDNNIDFDTKQFRKWCVFHLLKNLYCFTLKPFLFNNERVQ